MIWVLVDVLLGVAALAALVLTGFRLYRHVRVLTRTVGDSSRRLADASADLNAQQS